MILNLASELLLVICAYVDTRTLLRLSQINRQLRYRIIHLCLDRDVDQELLRHGYPRHALSHSVSRFATYHYKVPNMWRQMSPTVRSVLHTKVMYRPVLCSTMDTIVVSMGEWVHTYHRRSGVSQSPVHVHRQDVSAMAMSAESVVLGTVDGCVKRLIKGRTHPLTRFNSTIMAITPLSEGIVVAEKDSKVHVVNSNQVHTTQLRGQPWRMLTTSNCLVVATSGRQNPLELYHLAPTGLVSIPFTVTEGHRASIYALASNNDPHLFATGSYDGDVRVWDMRLNTSVLTCKALLDDTLTCEPVYDMDWDAYRLVSGTGRHGMIRLWDMRLPLATKVDVTGRLYLNRIHSPVYGVRLGVDHMWAVSDHDIWHIS